jgi:RimJ/RimL family protein N-acetyltransferase
MLKSLPLKERGFTIQACRRSDLDELAAWPDYPPPYHGFEFSFASMNPGEKDILFRRRRSEEDRITLIMDHQKQVAIGYVALVEIDWSECTVGNMGVRLHPAWCDRGVGTFMTSKVVDWCFINGIRRLRLDVAATNRRAVRSYEKLGFVQTGEFWRKDEKLKEVDLRQAPYDSFREHLRADSDTPEIHFWWMELSKQGKSGA